VVESLSVVIYDVDKPAMGAVSVANCAHAGSCLALEAGRGQSAENQGSGYRASELDRHRQRALPVGALNEYLIYLHRLGRSPNTVRAYAHHLQAFWSFLIEQRHDWRDLKLIQLAEFVGWVRHAARAGGGYRSDATINLILAAIGSFYEYQDRLGVEAAISRSRRFGAKTPYKPFLHHIGRTQSLRHAAVRVKAIKRLPRVFSPSEVQSLLDSCTRLRDRFLLCLLHESGMRIGQALGLRHADIRSYDGEIDIVPRANSNGALARSRSPYVVHVSKQAMALYADYLVHEYGEVSHDYVFVNWWGGQVGAPMRYATTIDLFRQLSKRTGLRATPHMFRHTHATDLLRAGWDAAYVQRRLGHAHIQTTVSTYAHLSAEDMGEMFERYQKERAR
jgi:integrase/recombinase XerD